MLSDIKLSAHANVSQAVGDSRQAWRERGRGGIIPGEGGALWQMT